MTDCSLISECLACITSVLQCYFILTGVGVEEKWSCVSSVVGRNVRMTVREETREFCPTPHVSSTSTGNEIVTYLSFALAVFCLIGIIVMAYWARKDRRRRSSPPPRPPPPNPLGSARVALSALTTYARRRQEERQRTRAIFEQRSAEFQRELAERLERVRTERAAAYPETPRNTPEPSHRPPVISRHQSNPPSNPPTRTSQPSSRAVSVEIESRGSSNWSSRATTPFSLSRTPTTFTREQTPSIPEINSHQPSPTDHTYDSPASTVYESIENSPDPTPPPIPNHYDQPADALQPPLPEEPRSSYGRLLKRTSFFKCKP